MERGMKREMKMERGMNKRRVAEPSTPRAPLHNLWPHCRQSLQHSPNMWWTMYNVLGPLHFSWWIKANYKYTHTVHSTQCRKIIISTIKILQRNPLQYISFITFSYGEPFLRGFLCGHFGYFWTQWCFGISKTCGRSARSFWRQPGRGWLAFGERNRNTS